MERWRKKRRVRLNEKRKRLGGKKGKDRGRGGKIEEEPCGCRDKVWGGCVA
jgi:hypothetical protein